MLIKLDLSPGQLKKVRSGKRVRIKPEIVGSGFSVWVDPKTYNLITRSVGKSKGVDLSLSSKELEMNMDSVEELKGEGIFGKKFDRALKKAGVKKAIYKAGDKLKPIAKEITKTAVSSVITPVLGDEAGDVIEEQVDKFYDKPNKFYSQFSGSGTPRYPVIEERRMGVLGGNLLMSSADGGIHPALLPQSDSAFYGFRNTTSKDPYLYVHGKRARYGGVGLYA